MKMNSEYEELIEEHCEHCYYNKNGVCTIARADKECVYGNLKHDLQELDLLRKLQKEHAKTKKVLEDIEDELGIDLITLFKALKNGIYKKENEEIKYISPNYLVFDNKYLFEYEYCTCRAKTKAKVYPYSLKKYGKTWALTREELL